MFREFLPLLVILGVVALALFGAFWVFSVQSPTEQPEMTPEVVAPPRDSEPAGFDPQMFEEYLHSR